MNRTLHTPLLFTPQLTDREVPVAFDREDHTALINGSIVHTAARQNNGFHVLIVEKRRSVKSALVLLKRKEVSRTSAELPQLIHSFSALWELFSACTARKCWAIYQPGHGGDTRPRLLKSSW